MKMIFLEQSISWADRSKGARSVSGVYGLVDVGEPDKVRYVGSSVCIAHRLYAHWRTSPSTRTPKGFWAAAVRAAGSGIAAVVLEEAEFVSKQDEARLALEQRHIQEQALRGGADLNVSMTPLGHVNSSDSRGKKRSAEFAALRVENIKLKAELAATRATSLQRATCCMCCTADSLCNVQRNTAPSKGCVAALQRDRVDRVESDTKGWV